MHYDPIKELLGRLFNLHPLLRRLFYRLLNILLLRSWHVRRTLRRLGPSLPPEAKVLDAGMGFGQYSWWMATRFPSWKITAADIKSEQVADCNAFFRKTGLSGRVQAVEADLVTWNSGESHDLVLCVDVMEHIAEDRTVFTNFLKMTAPGGYLVISTPSDQGGSDVHSDGDSSFIGEHVRDGYSMEEITEKLQTAGYGEVTVSYTYGTPGSIAWRLSMKYPVIMLSASKLFFILLPFYYLAVMPFVLALNRADLGTKHKKGTGLLVIARNSR
ncbi:MAG: class I SAM-dependent methyltransferase [Bacteroidales bacterium]|jgi:SAM-dependent methyltransferase|nr:class I SAM-dependent methyltransferase [Bacteroidales bacterium]